MCGRPGGRRSAPGASWHSMRRSSPRSPCAGRSASGWRPPRERTGGREPTGGRERTDGRKRRPRGARAVRGRRRGVLGSAGRVPAAAPHQPGAARIHRRARQARARAAPGRRALCLDAQPQPPLVPPGHRRRGVSAQVDSTRHARVRAAHPARGAGPLGALRRARAALDGGPRAQPLHRSRSAHSQRRGELPGAFRAMTTLAVLLVAAAALATGAVLGALVVQLRAAGRIEALRIELAAASVRLEASALNEADRLKLLEESETRLRAAFDSLAGETLRTNSELFLRLAREALGRDQAVAAGALRERELAIEQLVQPLRAALERTEAQVQSLECERREAFATLRTQIETLAGGQAQLQRETRNLATALRRPEVRGRWGELTLRRLVELAGLTEHCDFTEQLQVVGEGGSLRPDLVVHMPDARDLVIDAKTPLEAFLTALDAQSEEERREALRRHAQQVETRVRELASKEYWTQFERSPEFAVLFLPGDQFQIGRA